MPKFRVEVSSIKRIRSNDYYVVEADSEEDATDYYKSKGELEDECVVRQDVLDEIVTEVKEIK